MKFESFHHPDQGRHNVDDLEKVKLSETEKSTLSMIERMVEEGQELGAGNVAKVYALPEGTFCVKNIFNMELNSVDNSVTTEMNLMIEALKSNVRVPRPLFSVVGQEQACLVMEKIVGVSLRDIWRTGVRPPAAFQFDDFFSQLEKQVRRLNGAEIYHRDLHEGNVMVEEGSGSPVIIDFGRSCNGYGDEDPYRVVSFPRPDTTRSYLRDPNQVIGLRSKMGKYLQNINHML